jgi:cytochrome c
MTTIEGTACRQPTAFCGPISVAGHRAELERRKKEGDFTMNRYVILGGLCAALSLLATPSFAADDGEALVKHYTCNTCHALSDMETRVGPPYPAVALRYPDADKETIRKLSTKVIEGGAGTWGIMPMPAQSQVSPKEAEQMVRWILKQAPAAEPQK